MNVQEIGALVCTVGFADVQEIGTLVSTIGFPIVMCGLLFWYINKMTDTMTTAVQEMKLAVTELKNAVEEHYHNEAD